LSPKKDVKKESSGKVDKVIDKLSRSLGDDKLSTKRADLLSYSHDYWPIYLHWILKDKYPSLPDAVAWPESKEQVKDIVRWCYRGKVPIYPYGGGSGVLGAAVPESGGIVVDLKRMRSLNISEEDLLVEAESGLNGYYLEDSLNEEGYTMGNIPQSLYPSTVGGWVGTKALGQFSTKYGGIEDMLKGIEVVVPPGRSIELKPHPRTSTGPDLRKLFAGAEGTMGIMTKGWFKIWPEPQKRIKISYASESLEDAVRSIRDVMRRGAEPAVIRIYDSIETKRHFYEYEDIYGKIATVLVIEGDEKIAKAESEVVREEFIGEEKGEEPVDHWLETRFNVKEAPQFVPMGVVFDTIEVAVKWSDAMDLYHNVVESIRPIKGVLFASAHASHFYPQGICFYFTFAGIPPRRKDAEEFYQEAWMEAMNAVLKSNGTISHHHGIGRQRRDWMYGELGEAYNLLKEIKDRVDKRGIMNPGNMGL